MTWLTRCLLLWLWGVCPVSQAQSPALDFPVWQSLRVVVEHGAAWTPAQAWQHSGDTAALRLQHPSQILAPDNDRPHWAAFSVPGSYAQQLPLWLSFQSPTQEHAEMWLRFNDGPWGRQSPLHETAPSDWGSGQLFFTWPIYDATDRNIDVLIRVHGSNRVQFPVVLQKPEAFMQQHLKLCLLMGSVLAAPMLVVLYSITFLPVLKSKTLMLFIALALLEVVAAFWIGGLMHLMWPGLQRMHAAWMGCLAYGLLIGLCVYHAMAFMNTRSAHPRWHRFLHQMAWVWWLVFAACLLWWPTQVRMVLLLGGSVYAAILLFISVWYHRLQPGLTRAAFVSVWVVYLLGMLVYWLFRYLEWPLIVTLGTHFVQGALVVTLLGWSACMRVLHDREALRTQQKLTQERGRLFAAAHHDLWQPIQSMLLYARALVTAPASRRPALLSGLRLASHSVDDFMGHLRFWADGPNSRQDKPCVRTNLSVHALLQPLVEEMRLLAEQKHIYLRYQASSHRVDVDPLWVGRMVRNLLTNALRHTPAGGSVLIGCRRKKDVLWVWCMDTGTGMTQAQWSDGWDRVHHRDEPFTRSRSLGLGLYSFKALAHQMGLPTRWHSTRGKGTMIGFAVNLA